MISVLLTLLQSSRETVRLMPAMSQQSCRSASSGAASPFAGVLRRHPPSQRHRNDRQKPPAIPRALNHVIDVNAFVALAANAGPLRGPHGLGGQSSDRSYWSRNFTAWTLFPIRSAISWLENPSATTSATARSAAVNFCKTGTESIGRLERHAVHASVELEHEGGFR